MRAKDDNTKQQHGERGRAKVKHMMESRNQILQSTPRTTRAQRSQVRLLTRGSARAPVLAMM